MCTLPRTFIRIANVCYFPFVTLQHFIQVKATHTAKTYDSYFYPMVHITSLFSVPYYYYLKRGRLNIQKQAAPPSISGRKPGKS